MNLSVILFGLRLFSAALLLIFLASIAWLVYKDLQYSAESFTQQRSFGYLRVLESENGNLGIGALLPLLSVTSIGRAPGNTIVIDDNYISNQHLLITYRGNQWWLEDLGSRNGTLLNDVLLGESIVISQGDVIGLGSTQLRLEPEQTE